MRQFPVLLCALFLASPAMAQIADEPRLDGGRPDRVCTEVEFQQALAGEYAGPPCRFRRDRGSQAQISTGRSTLSEPVYRRSSTLGQAPRSTGVRHVAQSEYSSRSERSERSTVSTRRGTYLRSYPPETTSRRSTHSVDRYRSAGWESRTRRRHESRAGYETAYEAGYGRSRGETVRLGDSFFRGSTAGGVGRSSQVLYVYRGNIVITATGEYYLGFPGEFYTSGLPLRMDDRAYHPRTVMPARRAFP